MKLRFTMMTLALWCCVTAVHAAPPPATVAQVFGCHMKEGQSADNVWALMDGLRANATSRTIADAAFGLFVWVPYRGATEYDFVLGVLNADLNTMAAGSMDYVASAGFQALSARFQALTTGCDSAIMLTDQLSTGKIGMTDGDRTPDAVIETFSCKINAGSTMNQVNETIKFWQAQIPKIDSAALKDYQAYLWTPFRGGTGSDFVWVGNSPDLATWAKGSADYVNSAAGKAADARFDAVSTCTNQMWMGYWVLAPKSF